MTCPSRQFLIRQAVLNACAVYERQNGHCERYGAAWCCEAYTLRIWSDDAFIRSDFVDCIRAQFRILAEQYADTAIAQPGAMR